MSEFVGASQPTVQDPGAPNTCVKTTFVMPLLVMALLTACGDLHRATIALPLLGYWYYICSNVTQIKLLAKLQLIGKQVNKCTFVRDIEREGGEQTSSRQQRREVKIVWGYFPQSTTLKDILISYNIIMWESEIRALWAVCSATRAVTRIAVTLVTCIAVWRKPRDARV